MTNGRLPMAFTIRVIKYCICNILSTHSVKVMCRSSLKYLFILCIRVTVYVCSCDLGKEGVIEYIKVMVLKFCFQIYKTALCNMSVRAWKMKGIWNNYCE